MTERQPIPVHLGGLGKLLCPDPLSNCCLLAAPRSGQKVLGREVPKNMPTLKPLYSTWAVKPLTRGCVFPFSLQEHNQARGHRAII